jgi:hypothetical protein
VNTGRVARVSRVSAGPIVITRFAPLELTHQQVLELYEQSVPRFATTDELAGKAYLLGRDGMSGGAIYFWRSEDAPESVFDASWRSRVMERYGVEPVVDIFDSPIRIGFVSDYPERV